MGREVEVCLHAGLARRAPPRVPARLAGRLPIRSMPGRAAVPEALALDVLTRIAGHGGILHDVREGVFDPGDRVAVVRLADRVVEAAVGGDALGPPRLGQSEVAGVVDRN